MLQDTRPAKGAVLRATNISACSEFPVEHSASSAQELEKMKEKEALVAAANQVSTHAVPTRVQHANLPLLGIHVPQS